MPAGQTQVFGKQADGQNAPIGASEPVAATQTLTLAANATSGETFTIGGLAYTWKTALGTSLLDILLAGNASDSIDNAIAVVNRTNPLVTAAPGAGDTMVVTARVAGAQGNGITTTEAMANGSWGSTTLTGGAYGALSVSGAGGGSSPAGAPVTATSVGKTAGQSGTIPAGAKGWTFTILTGTATFNGVAALPAGFSESDVNTLTAAIAYAFASPGTGYIRYNT